ncbi:MarR family transcriptional regulator [Peptostreptococcus canis]|uniref:MarR family transcriptional regulator n=1 Tax=Peptostreptococcus canis TaxID=1159213 RepID=A0ABR6TKP5_9FIRM|nr:MarR family transcriptional regulator [Peptostreptococcus canis]
MKVEDKLNYENSRKVINDIIVELFKNILTIEERSLRNRGIRDLSMTEIHTIEAIGINGSKTMSEVAEALDITMGTLTISITRLENKGYVYRTKDPNDRRVVLASLTKKGELVDKIHRNFHDEMIDHVMIDLKLDEDQALISALKNINEFFLREYGGTNVY